MFTKQCLGKRFRADFQVATLHKAGGQPRSRSKSSLYYSFVVRYTVLRVYMSVTPNWTSFFNIPK